MDNGRARHFDLHSHSEKESAFLPQTKTPTFLISAGASCPDAVVERVIRKLQTYFPESKSVEAVLAEFTTV
jgi:4-hydroxy-3-methylbut-2-enyl diphosphate reductase